MSLVWLALSGGCSPDGPIPVEGGTAEGADGCRFEHCATEDAGGSDGLAAPDAAMDTGIPEIDAQVDVDAEADVDARADVDATAFDAGGQRPSCLDGLTGYDREGPFTWSTKQIDRIHLWVPEVPTGCRVPAIHLANGTGAMCTTYQGILQRLASHGFLALCYESPSSDAGAQGMEAFETALTNFPDLVDHKLGSAGHEVGAQEAILTLRLAEAKWGDTMKYAGLAIQPMSGAGSPPEGGTWQELYLQVRSPLVMFRAAEDPLIPAWIVQATYDALSDSTEAYFWSVVGVDGILIPDARNQEISVAWFRWKLLSDQDACRFFKALPEGPNWQRNTSKNEQACE